MNYAQQQRNPSKHMMGIAAVIVFHILLVWALVSGLARKVVEVIKQPLETKIIEEVKPPAEEAPPPPPPKFAPPPPPVIPPPEVSVAAPVNAGPTISAVTREKPPPAPPAPPAAPPAPPAPKPAVQTAIGAACPNATATMANIPYPRNAQRDGITGSFIIEFTVAADGSITNPTVIGQGHKYLTDAAKAAVMSFKCVAQGQEVKVQAPFSFKLE